MRKRSRGQSLVIAPREERLEARQTPLAMTWRRALEAWMLKLQSEQTRATGKSQ